MIPLKLEIKNFLSYGPTQSIDFEPYNLLCLSGKNGHGKSALLDALTWVLWGQARKVGGTAKADEGLMHLGQTHMMVSLDFYCNNILYRVRREFTLAANKTHANLEFGILDPATNTLRPLTDKTIRATQAKIDSMLGLDYETFVNSAFLRQGQSHEFSKKTPKERKEILATILGLDRFENIRRLAMDKAKDAHAQKEQCVARRERLSVELNEKPRIYAALNQTELLFKDLTSRELTLQTTLKEIKIQLNQCALQKAQTEKIVFQKQHLEEQRAACIKQIIEESARWRAILRQSRTTKTIKYEEERTLLQNELQNLQIQAAQKIQLKETHSARQESLRHYVQTLQENYKQALEKVQFSEHTIMVSLKTGTEKIQELTNKKALAQENCKKIDHESISLTKEAGTPIEQALLASKEKLLERRKAYYHTFISKANALSAKLAAIEHKKQLTHASETAQCPLCEQVVADKDALTAKFDSEEKMSKHQLHRLTIVIKDLKKILIEDHAALELFKKKAEQQKLIQVQIVELQKQKQKSLQEFETYSQDLATHSQQLLMVSHKKEELAKESKQITESFQAAQRDESFIKMKNDVLEIEQHLAKIVYNPTRDKEIHERLSALSHVAAQQSAFLKEAALQEERKNTIYQKCAAARDLKKQIIACAPAVAQLKAYATQEATLVVQEEQTLKTLEALTKEKELLIHQKGALEAQNTALKAREVDFKNVEKAVTAAATLENEYDIVATALSKDGIQALLIEDALPEIEHEANELLSKLTDNQAHLTIESLRDLKSGRTKETLDIKISDAVGVRPYELFSGGEAFRIDFALRIALSKLLARRSGTALQTLIIDEGFGSQDEEGLSHIVDALTRIQEDFAKIIIVSHLPSLKEQFPVHFVVTKSSEGSAVTVVENC